MFDDDDEEEEVESEIHSLLASYKMLMMSVQRTQGLQVYVMIADIICKFAITLVAIPLALEFWASVFAK